MGASRALVCPTSRYDTDCDYCCNLPGDANNDGEVIIFDITYLIDFLYHEGPAPACWDEGNANGDANINLFDITYLQVFLYSEGPAPTCP